jgi:hypothetical protein
METRGVKERHKGAVKDNGMQGVFTGIERKVAQGKTASDERAQVRYGLVSLRRETFSAVRGRTDWTATADPFIQSTYLLRHG